MLSSVAADGVENAELDPTHRPRNRRGGGRVGGFVMRAQSSNLEKVCEEKIVDWYSIVLERYKATRRQHQSHPGGACCCRTLGVREEKMLSETLQPIFGTNLTFISFASDRGVPPEVEFTAILCCISSGNP